MAKKEIDDIYVDYFQKSKVFLYPALGIKKGTSVTPIETYLEWGDNIKLSDRKLVCLYYLRDDDEFISFEENHLLKNPLFEDCIEVDGNKAVYIFNFEEYSEDFDHVVNGRYSLLSQKLKDKIRDSYGVNSANYMYVKSYLYPSYYYKQYASILCPDANDNPKMMELLNEVGELCSKPDFKKESLKIVAKSLKL